MNFQFRAQESPEMNVRVSVGGEDDNDSSDSDSELAQVKQKVEDEGAPWVANEDSIMPSMEENLLLSAKGETGLGSGLGDDVSHRVRISNALWGRGHMMSSKV